MDKNIFDECRKNELITSVNINFLIAQIEEGVLDDVNEIKEKLEVARDRKPLWSWDYETELEISTGTFFD